MTETLILVADGDLYRVNSTGWQQYRRNLWASPYVWMTSGSQRLYARTVGRPARFRYGVGNGEFSTSNIVRIVPYDAQAHASFEEALYAAEWIQGYEYRVKLTHAYGNMDARNWHNPYSMGTPEQKWFENGYYAAATEERKAKEGRKMKHCTCLKGTPDSECPLNRKPVVELPDAKVEILLKLHERLAAQDKLLKLAYGEFGQLTYENSPIEVLKKAKIALKGYQDSISSLKTAIGVVKALA